MPRLTHTTRVVSLRTTLSDHTCVYSKLDLLLAMAVQKLSVAKNDIIDCCPIVGRSAETFWADMGYQACGSICASEYVPCRFWEETGSFSQETCSTAFLALNIAC